MCKKTSGSQTAVTNAVFNTRKGAGGGGPPAPAPIALPPDLESGLPGPIFGSPDFVPQLTFIAAGAPADAFLNQATIYHTNSSLSPRVASSIEALVTALDTQAETGTGLINRLRIVSHVFNDTSGQSAPTAMMIRFLEGGANRTLKRYFAGFAAGRIAALKSMMEFEIGNFNTTSIFVNSDSAADIAQITPAAHSALVAAIPTDALGGFSADFDSFFRICGSLRILNMNLVPNATMAANLRQAYNILYEDLRPRLAPTLTVANADILRDAIAGVGAAVSANAQVLVNPTPPPPLPNPTPVNRYNTNLTAALALLANNNFFDKLNRVRQRFNQASKIDIRGCQVGRDPDFLRALRAFFGVDATVRPTISGPEWFQHYNPVMTLRINNNANLTTFHTNGQSGHTGAEVAAAVALWRDGFGVGDNHLTAWSNALNLNALAFLSLAWRATIPAAKVTVAELTALNGADFAATIRQIARIFLLASATVPNAAAFTAVQPLLADAATTSAQLTAPVADNATAAQLKAGFDQLKSIYERVDNRFTGGGGSPPAAQRIVPATQPAPFTAANLRDLQSALTTFIDTHANSKLRPIKQFIAAAHGRVTDAPAGLRYLMGLGLPLLLHRAGTNEPDVNNLVVVFSDPATAVLRQDAAIRQWMRAQWRGILPPGLGGALTFANLETPWLVEIRQTGGFLNTPPFTISPTDEYQSHIITLLSSDP
jgi:hypothetical protein